MDGMFFFFFQAEDGIRDIGVTGVQTCALPITSPIRRQRTRTPSGPQAWTCRISPPPRQTTVSPLTSNTRPRVLQLAGPGHLGVPAGAVLRRALLRLVVDAHDAEPPAVPPRPLEVVEQRPQEVAPDVEPVGAGLQRGGEVVAHVRGAVGVVRSEERRVGKECRSRWSPYH